MTTNLRRILFPTDFTDDSAQAASYALSLAVEHQAALTLLHVTEESGNDPHEDFERVIALQERLRSFLPAGNELPVPARFEVDIGPVEKSIIHYSREQSSDLIVMGLKNRTTLGNHLPWRLAYNIVSEAPCPVLTIRSR